MNKKAASEIISYVLLIGLSIALATAIGLWAKSESKKVVETTVQESETDTRCAEVHLGGFRCTKQDGSIEINLKNRGVFNIVGLRYICSDSSGAVIGGKQDLSSPLQPDGEQSLNNINGCDSTKDITLTPFININTKEIICPEGKKIIDSTEQC